MFDIGRTILTCQNFLSEVYPTVKTGIKTHEYRKNRFVKVPLNTFYILFFVDNNYSTSIQQRTCKNNILCLNNEKKTVYF